MHMREHRRRSCMYTIYTHRASCLFGWERWQTCTDVVFGTLFAMLTACHVRHVMYKRSRVNSQAPLIERSHAAAQHHACCNPVQRIQPYKVILNYLKPIFWPIAHMVVHTCICVTLLTAPGRCRAEHCRWSSLAEPGQAHGGLWLAHWGRQREREKATRRVACQTPHPSPASALHSSAPPETKNGQQVHLNYEAFSSQTSKCPLCACLLHRTPPKMHYPHGLMHRCLSCTGGRVMSCCCHVIAFWLVSCVDVAGASSYGGM